MIQVSADLIMNPILLHLDKLINIGLHKGATSVSADLFLAAREILEAQVKASGGNWTGNLSNAISARAMDTGLTTYAQAEVFVNVSKAPYAEWVEMGKYATNIPYKSTDKRNYRTSKFTGHHYLEKAIRKVKRTANNTVLTEIFNSVANPIHAGKIL